MSGKIFSYICQTCGKLTEKFHPLKEPHRCKDCARESGNANLKKHSGDYYLKKKLIKERGSTCEYCGVECKVMLHHKIEIRNGGETSRENCVLLCQNCHKKQHGGAGVGAIDYWYDKKFPSKA